MRTIDESREEKEEEFKESDLDLPIDWINVPPKKPKKEFNYKAWYIMALLLATISLIVCSIFLGSSFMNMDKEGFQCLSDPLTFAEVKTLEKTHNQVYCNCEEKPSLYQFNYSFGEWNK